jgi:hypothetical protein
MSYLFIKNQFQTEKFVLFSSKIKNFKKPKKNFFSGFLAGVFRVGFFGWVFYCQPCLAGVEGALLAREALADHLQKI